jgi:hypothetical protein
MDKPLDIKKADQHGFDLLFHIYVSLVSYIVDSFTGNVFVFGSNWKAQVSSEAHHLHTHTHTPTNQTPLLRSGSSRSLAERSAKIFLLFFCLLLIFSSTYLAQIFIMLRSLVKINFTLISVTSTQSIDNYFPLSQPLFPHLYQISKLLYDQILHSW